MPSVNRGAQHGSLLPRRLFRNSFGSTNKSHCRCRVARHSTSVKAQIIVFNADDIYIERSLGTAGFMQISSYAPSTSESSGSSGMGLSELQARASQSMSEGDVTVRWYRGRIAVGELSGARVLLKAYPQTLAGINREADIMAANELACHAALQPPSVAAECERIVKLMGGFIVEQGASKGEQWLVFRDDGATTAADYATKAADATAAGTAVGDGEFWDRFDAERSLSRRRTFVLSVLRQVLQALAFMHDNNRLHQSLGPASVVLSTTNELDVKTVAVRVRDLAFSVDCSDEALYGGATLGELWDAGTNVATAANPTKKYADALWRRARSQGAFTEVQRRNYGVADDVYAAGLFIAYMCFVPFCTPGSIDGPSLQRLLESTFRLDFAAIREYCAADERWQHAVAFLDAGQQAGWLLLQDMMNPEWRLRPTIASCLKHPFLTGEAFETDAPSPPQISKSSFDQSD